MKNLIQHILIACVLTLGIGFLLTYFISTHNDLFETYEERHINQLSIKHTTLLSTLKINQACYDEQTNTWFVYTNANSPGWSEGWYYEYDYNIDFKFLGNGTAIITNIPHIFNIQINVNNTGLNCRTTSN